MIGQLLNQRYRLLREIGGGGMGTVYEAVRLADNAHVAVKVVSAEVVKCEPDLLLRFEREARAACSFETPHVVPAVDAGTDRDTGLPYLVMPLMRGEDAQQLVERLGPLPVDVALRIVQQASLGLAAAHAAGVVHRDIKPANLFLSHEPEGQIVVKLLDFGVAKLGCADVCLSLTRSGMMLGSPHYMSPEQARGRLDADHRADLWSLGVVAYKLISGRLPFQHIRGLGDLLVAICCEPTPPLASVAPWVRPEVAQLVHKALRAEPALRFQTALDMAVAAGRLLQTSRPSLHGASLPPRVLLDDEMDTLPWLASTQPPPITQSIHPLAG